MVVYLVRHPAVAAPKGLCYGRLDVPLAPNWVGEAAQLRQRLLARVLDGAEVLSSPAERCRKLAAALGEKVAIETGLAEFDFGAWEGRDWAEIPVAELDAWNADLANYSPPGGESLTVVCERAWECLAQRRARGASRLVCVSHGGTIRALLCEALGMPLSEVFRLSVDFLGVSAVEFRAHGPRVLFVNR